MPIGWKMAPRDVREGAVVRCAARRNDTEEWVGVEDRTVISTRRNLRTVMFEFSDGTHKDFMFQARVEVVG